MDKARIRPLGERTLVKSRGVKEDMDCGLVIPEKFLRCSDVCTTDDGRTVVIRGHSGKDVGDGYCIVDNKNILAEIVEGCIVPLGKIIHVRKCEDFHDGIERVGNRRSQFAEVLACGKDSCGAREKVQGWFVYVNEDALGIQAVEDGFDEWLIDESDVLFYTAE